MDNKVLVLGNGFDLAHGLPTSYSNFIEFISMLDEEAETYELKEYLLNNVNGEYYCIDKIDYVGLREKYKKFDINECGVGFVSYLKLTKNIDKWVDFEDEVLTLLKVCNEWNSIFDSQECIFSTSSKAHNTGDYVLEIFNTYDKLDNATIRKYNNCLDKLTCFTPIYKQGIINKEYIINDFEISTSKVFAVLNEALKQLEELFNWYIVNVVDCLMAKKLNLVIQQLIMRIMLLILTTLILCERCMMFVLVISTIIMYMGKQNNMKIACYLGVITIKKLIQKSCVYFLKHLKEFFMIQNIEL